MGEPSTRTPRLVKDVISVLSSNVAVLGISVLLSVIVTRQLGPENKGIYVALTAYPLLLVHLVDMGIRQATTYHIGKKVFPEHQVMTGTVMLYLLTTGIGVALCMFLFGVLNNPHFTPLLVGVALLNIPVMLLVSYASGIFLGKEMIGQFSGMRWLPTALNFLVALLLVLIFRLSVLGVLVASLIGNLVMALYAIWLLGRKTNIRFEFSGAVMKAMVLTGLGFSLPLLINSLTYRFSVIMMERLSTPAQLGIYATSAGMIEMLWQVPAALGLVMFSRSANAKDGQAFTQQATRFFRVCMCVMLVLGGVAMLLAPQVMTLLYGDRFSASGHLFRLALPGALLLITFKVLNMDLAGKGKPYYATLAMLPAFLVSVGLNYWLIPRYHAVGASISDGVSYAVGGLLFVPIYLRVTGTSWRELVLVRRDDFAFIPRLLRRPRPTAAPTSVPAGISEDTP